MNCPYEPNIPHRRSIRLQSYDYSQPGAYFVTVCSHGRKCLFGEVSLGEMHLNEAGEAVLATWREMPDHFPGIAMNAVVVMPNHLHGIIEIVGAIPVGAIHELPLRPQTRSERRKMVLPKIVGRFKMQSAKTINLQCSTPGIPVWQRNYYEHVIRNDEDYRRIAEYIADNPRRWEEDSLHPNNWPNTIRRHRANPGNVGPGRKGNPGRGNPGRGNS